MEQLIRGLLEQIPLSARVPMLEKAWGIKLLPGGADPALPLPTTPPGSPPPRSYPLTVPQAHELMRRMSKDNPLMEKILTMAVRNVVGGVAVVHWRDILPLTNGMAWGDFGRRIRAGLHRSLRSILGDEAPHRVELLWEAPGWIAGDVEGQWVDGELRIDGPAVNALKAVLLPPTSD